MNTVQVGEPHLSGMCDYDKVLRNFPAQFKGQKVKYVLKSKEM